MGFAENLQSKTSHEALVSLQDAELRLLENMRKCISLRVKCDREYAVALNSIHAQALKVEQTEELKSSIVARAWTSIIEETNSLSHLVKQNADFLATRTLETLTNLISEKRALRKHYVEEHTRIHGNLTKIRENVVKIKIEYERCMESWKIAKAKYEDQYIKGKSNKKLEELKEKYQKSTRKLHRLHNEYVLLLCEASEYEARLRTVLIPDLLEYQQIVLQESVETWKSILKEYSHYTDVTSEGFQAIQKKMRDTVDRVTGEEEYKEFSIKNKSVPLEPVSFQFEESILEDYAGKLKAAELTVDDFTFDALKAKMEEVWSKLTQIKGDIKSRENQMTQYEAEITALRRTADTALTLSVKKRAVDILKKQLGELKCQEEILKKLWEILDAPLNMVGPEGPPPGLELEDTTMGANKIDSAAETASITSHKVGRSAKVVIDRICNQLHIKRNPGEASPKLPPRSTVVFNNSKATSPLAKKSSVNNISMEDGAPDLLGLHDHDDRDDKSRANLSSSKEMKDLRDEDWFHGVLPREEVIRLLVKDGDYLVRETLRNDESQIVLSANWQGYKHFIVQTTADGKFRFEGPAFNTIRELIKYQQNCGLPVTIRSGAILRNPILRERWELNNDDVQLLEKIGRGNFGDVYKAILKSTSEEVAVKTCRMNLPDEQKKKFLQEGRILKQYDHPNIVKFIGIGVQKQPIMIVMELVPGGSLLLYLRNNNQTLTVPQLLALSIQAASGMEYLEGKGCIHRDLAARNCLVGRGDIVKISDFGMSREEEEYIVSDGMKQIPIKWTAPEALNFGKYTSLCDVWSFGILAWEIMSLGSTPYCGLSNNQTRELIDTGYRLPNPENTPEAVYEILLRCWEYTPERRPHFREIRTVLEAIAAEIAQT